MAVLYSLLIFIMSSLSSCGQTKFGEKIIVATSDSMQKMLEVKGTPELEQGLYDGCLTANWSRGNSFYRTFAFFKQDPSLITNTVYRWTWSKAYVYCFQDINYASYQKFGSHIVNNRMTNNNQINFDKQGPYMPIGRDSHKAGKWEFDESINNGIPGFSAPSKTENIFGFFGTCQFC